MLGSLSNNVEFNAAGMEAEAEEAEEAGEAGEDFSEAEEASTPVASPYPIGGRNCLPKKHNF